MGRPNTLPADRTESVKLSLRCLRWVDGDYDQGGAYWGQGRLDHPTSIYRAAGYTKFGDFVEVFVRAAWYQQAKDRVLEQLPMAHFYR